MSITVTEVRDNEISSRMQLQAIEYRIRCHMNNAGNELLHVGACLNEAKPLVRHGDWEGWVLENTGMSVRSAQRLMQAANEVSDDSILAQLPISKIQMLLPLPEEQREALGRRAVDEDLTQRQLRAEIDRLTGRAESAEKRLDAAMRKANEADAKRAENEKYLKGRIDQLARANDALRDVPTPDEKLEKENYQLKKQLDTAVASLQEAQQFADEQAEKRQQAQDELMALKSGQARGEIVLNGIGAVDVMAAIRTFIGTAGVLPQMGEQLAAMGPARQKELSGYVDMVDNWVKGTRAAMRTVLADGWEVK